MIIDFGAVDNSFATNRWLFLDVVAEGAATVHLGYDAAPHPSRLEVAVLPGGARSP